MTKEEIDALEGLRAAGTPGPWVEGGVGQFVKEANRGDVVADLRHGRKPYADAALIIAAVNALPALIAEVREAGARELEAVADDMGDDLHASLAECRTVYQEAAVFASYLRSRAASLRKDAR